MNAKLYKAVIAVLVVFFLGGIGLGLWNITMNEGVFLPEETPKESKTPAPQATEAAAAYLECLVAEALGTKPKVNKTTRFSIPDEGGIAFSVENPLLDATAAYMKDKITTALNAKAQGCEVLFGDDFSTLLSVPRFSPAGGFDAVCTDKKVNDAGEAVLQDTNEIEVRFHPEAAPQAADSLLAQNFAFRTDAEIKELFGGTFDAYFTIDSHALQYNNCRITASANRFSDKLQTLTFIKSTTAALRISPVGALAPLGKMTCTVVFEESESYAFTWPGVQLNYETLAIEKGKTQNLLAYITASGDMRATWESSDESVVSVDSEGYLKSHKFGEATVRAAIEFQGRTYTDECLVQVRVSVDSIRLNKHKLILTVGETAELSAKISPRKATVKTYRWFTENPDVATVDANGVVTAAGAGETKVYVLSDDGSYRSSCRIFVE
ncbi:MAG: Ig-like domain-containing protein [Oscillospiraceae bacterium]|jgi:hypothetical protein|nr:Ig-like domain-containing protein [Oscillospiraceae bacterium]